MGTWDLGKVHHGVGISMRGMNFVNFSKEGSITTIGGGTDSGEVIRDLWSQGKQTGMVTMLPDSDLSKKLTGFEKSYSNHSRTYYQTSIIDSLSKL